MPPHLALLPLLASLVPLAVFTLLVQRRVRSWWLLLPLGFALWALVHASGVHATVAGMLLGFAVPVLSGRQAAGRRPGPGWPNTSSREAENLAADGGRHPDVYQR